MSIVRPWGPGAVLFLERLMVVVSSASAKGGCLIACGGAEHIVTVEVGFLQPCLEGRVRGIIVSASSSLVHPT